MRLFFTRLIQLLAFTFFPGLLFAQNLKDYNLLLNSGKFIPEENIRSISKSSETFQKSFHNDKYYVTIQFNSLPTEVTKAQLKSAGVELLDYIPYLAYTSSVNKELSLNEIQNFGIRSIVHLTAAQKTVPDILINKAPAYAIVKEGYADLNILLYKDLPADAIINSLNEAGASIIGYVAVFRMYTVRVPLKNLAKVAGLPFIQWTEFISPPNVPENLPGRISHRVNGLNDGVRNLKGDGMKIGVWDEVVSQHLDFLPAGRLINADGGGAGTHGTHLTGTIGGRGLIDPRARGMAPNATLYSYNGYDGAGGGGHFDNNLAEMAAVIPANTLIASNHSYHDGLGVQCAIGGTATSYSLRARNADINLNNNTYHLHCHSAGNAQGSCTGSSGGFFSITGTGKAAKNNIVVGALTSADAMTSYSSFGPANDGRVKPEICAVGDAVYSTYLPLNTYNTISGTSMATPGVAGTLSLLAQRYKQLNSNNLPPSSLIKNIACNTAEDLGNPGPDYRFGYGRINALSAVKILEQNRYAIASIATGGSSDITISIPAGTARLRVMLTWNDPAGAANAAMALVNNLDLRVIEGANTYLPWVLNPNSPASNATQADDNISNIEQVTINNPAAGTYTLRVIGEAIPTGPDQTYSLTWDVEQPFIEITYPNGGESFSPGATQAITWDNAGITGVQTVQYSTNNGGSWTTISSTVAANTKRLVWSVPAGISSSTALIRVFSGAITDNSDANFKILGTPALSVTGAVCNAGEITYSWPAVTNATQYDLYRLDNTVGSFVLLASNIAGTSYTATGLTPGVSVWAALVAKNNIDGAESERSLAVSATVSTGGLPPIGSINGQSSVCGNGNVVYTVPVVTGATSYTWTAPPNATITNGQGTNTVTINYTAASNSGDVNVFASSTNCQTSAAILAVTVNPAVAAPTAGGNQTYTVCPPAATPTLTATATVPAGHTVVWYDAASGGNTVASPTLSSVGNITYYAASRSTNTTCESAIRSAVMLTINAALPAGITAGGPVTFCQGGNVVLTASAGTSYLWSNGSTSQTIAVNASGSFTVKVTTGGCELTSPVTTVTVNPLPAATITASGPTTFCDGSNVVLTASNGATYLWSNGATTQSVTVSSTGANTVRVTNASGCFANSAATNVTVNTKPSVTISAAPYTKLFPGLNTTLTGSITPAGTYTYTWLKNGMAVTGATGNSIPVSLDQLGSYTLTVTNNSTPPCSNTSAALIIADSVTSKLFVYPNPSQGDFQIRYYTTNVSAHSISIYDSKGSLVYRKSYSLSIPYQQMDVNISKHGSGVYQVVLHDKNGKKLATRQVVIQ